MTIGEALRDALDILGDIHVLGRESAKMTAAVADIQAVIDAMDKRREERANED